MWCEARLAFLVMGLGMSHACTMEKTCTTIGCTDEFSLALTVADGRAPQFDIHLVVDGETIDCKAPALGSSARCDYGVNVTILTSGARVQEILTIQRAPASVTVSLVKDGATKPLGTFSPTYESVQPNGPGCDPACQQVSMVQVIDPWP